MVLPSSDGVSRTATAPGPKDSIASPNEASSSARAIELFDGRLVEFDDLRNQQDLPLHAVARQRRLQLFIDDALMGGVLIDHDRPSRVCDTI